MSLHLLPSSHIPSLRPDPYNTSHSFPPSPSPHPVLRIITFINSQAEPLSAAKGGPPNPWHSSAGGGGGCIIS